MDVMCLMGLFPEEFEKEVYENSISGTQNAANKLQWAIVEGLVCQENINLQILNSMFVGSFPKRYKKISIPSFSFNVNGTEIGQNVGFINISVVKVFSRYFTVKKRLKEWIDSDSGDDKIVIAYAMTSPIVELLHFVKSYSPKVKCVLLVPDLPEYMDISRQSPIYKFLKKKHIAHLKKQLRCLDGYVFLTEYMKDWFDYDVKYTVVEGIYKEDDLIHDAQTKKEKVILYSGSLREEYGILDLVEAFQKINAPDWTLEIIGDGSLLPTLKEICEKDARIALRGLMPNSQVVQRQRQVSILVNPRKGDQSFTQYSFPSKTIEYMASGTSMMGYRLSGIPDEYFNFMFVIPSETDGFVNCLRKVMSLQEEERNEFGLKAQSFIQTQKNAKSQCFKIVELIKGLI